MAGGPTVVDPWAEVVQLWRGTDSMKPVPRSFVRLLLILGLRRGEAAAALWSNVHLESVRTVDGREVPAFWHIPAEVRKGRVAGSAGERRALDVPLPALAVRILLSLREANAGGDLVFPHLWLGGIGAMLREHAGIADLRIHDLRRSAASAIQSLGAPPHVLSAVLGHVEQGGADSDQHYTHGSRFAEHHLWLDRWAAKLEQLIADARPSDVASSTEPH